MSERDGAGAGDGGGLHRLGAHGRPGKSVDIQARLRLIRDGRGDEA